MGDEGSMSEAVRGVIEAWTVPGPRPDIHRQAQERLRRDWPALARAVQRLVSR